MAIALVANTGVAGNGTTATTGAIDTTGANFLIMTVAFFTSTTPTISDSKGNTWTALTLQADGTTSGRLYYVENPTVGTGHTFEASGSSTFPSLCVAAFSGVKLSSPFDQEEGDVNGAVSSILATGSITPSENNELIISGAATLATGSESVDSGLTITDQIETVGGVNFGSALAYKVQTTAAAINATWTFSGSSSAAAMIASFKEAAAGARKFILTSPA